MLNISGKELEKRIAMFSLNVSGLSENQFSFVSAVPP